MSDINRPLNPLGEQTLTVSSTALSLTVPDGARRAFMTLATDAIRYWFSGSTPTNLVGHSLAANDSLSLTGAHYRSALLRMKVIRVTNDATLSITYFD